MCSRKSDVALPHGKRDDIVVNMPDCSRNGLGHCFGNGGGQKGQTHIYIYTTHTHTHTRAHMRDGGKERGERRERETDPLTCQWAANYCDVVQRSF